MRAMRIPLLALVCVGLVACGAAVGPVAVVAAVAAEAAEGAASAGPPLVIVERGQPRAEIVVAAQRPRMVTLAALELRHFVAKMSGARLPIVTEPTASVPLKIYVGRSAHTDRLAVAIDGLRDGAYRMVSGPDWLVLIGRDVDFDPTRLPWPIDRKDVPRAEAEWERAIEGQTDAAWGFPFVSGFKGFWNPKDFSRILSAYYGEDFAAIWGARDGAPAGFWDQDEGGSLNAVCGLLRGLGVRWFMPGEIGQVVPERTTIAIEPCDVTVRPDFAVRKWLWYNYAAFGFDDVIWAKRIGMNSGHEQLGPSSGPHGLVFVHSHPSMKQAHPEYYALIGGKRDIEHRGHGTPCFTSAGLLRETVNYTRFLFDRYDLPSVDLWPVDGLRLCECEGCAGKSASELVWGFVDRVAREVHQTHPTKRITCGAYTSYADPPDTIDAFSPNLSVWISNCGRPMMEDPEHWAQYWERIRKWRSKLAPGNLLRLENNRYHIWGEGEPIAYPVLHPRAVARDLSALKGISLGDSGEQSQVGGKWRAPALEHITLYVQSRFLWDADQRIDQLLDEYCTLFYGPAAEPMKEAIEFAERNLAYKDQSRSRGRANPSNVPLAVSLRLRELLGAARQTAGDTLHGRRIEALLAELQPGDELIAQYREKEEALANARARAPVVIGADGSDVEKARSYALKDNSTRAEPAAPTTFRVGWDGDAIWFDIICREPEMNRLRASRDVYGGDYVVVLLATPLHSYYYLEINPDGLLLEGDPNPNWKSLAELKTQRGEDSWRVQLRIPVVGPAEALADPRHRVAGSKPTAQEPWFFNVGRQRVVDLPKPELQAFSPTGAGWHAPERFARLQIE